MIRIKKKEKKTYLDDEYMECPVEENAGKVLKKFLFRRYGVAKEIKKNLQASKTLLEAFQNEIRDGDIDKYFSDKVGVILKKIKRKNTFALLTSSETIVFFSDFLMPVVFQRIEPLVSLSKVWICSECKVFWNGLNTPLKKEIFSIAYEESYKEPRCNFNEIFVCEYAKYPALRGIITPCIDMNYTFKQLVINRDIFPHNIYGYMVRYYYMVQTRNVTTELLQEVFSGLSREDLMIDIEFDIYNSLSENITIYRGTDAAETIPRLSWSLDVEVAKKYDRGKLMKATIPKKQILAYLHTDEKEVIVWVNADDVELL